MLSVTLPSHPFSDEVIVSNGSIKPNDIHISTKQDIVGWSKFFHKNFCEKYGIYIFEIYNFFKKLGAKSVNCGAYPPTPPWVLICEKSTLPVTLCLQ